jgi:hypothetical protein
VSVISSDLVDRLGRIPTPASAAELADPSALGEAVSALGYFDGNIYDASAVGEATIRLKADQGLGSDDLVDAALVVHLITLVTNGVVTGQIQQVDNIQRVDPAELVEMDFPPQPVGGNVDLDDPDSVVQLIDKVCDKVQIRLGEWVDKVQIAIDGFVSAAEERINTDPLFDEGDASVGFAGVVTAFAEAVLSNIPATGQFAGAIRSAYDFLGAVQGYFEEQHLGVSGAKQRLATAIAQLHQAALKSLDQFTDTFQRQEGQTVWDSPLGQAVWDALTWVEEGSTDPDYVAALCDWLMQAPTSENTTQPIREALDFAFDIEYRAVAEQLLREQGYDVNTY